MSDLTRDEIEAIRRGDLARHDRITGKAVRGKCLNQAVAPEDILHAHDCPVGRASQWVEGKHGDD